MWAAIDTANGLWQSLVGFLADFEQSFPGLSDRVGQARDAYFLPMAFVFLVYKLIKEAGTSGASGQLKAILRATILVAVIALAPKMINVLAEGFEALAEELGSDGSPRVLIGQLEEFAAESAALATGAPVPTDEETEGGFFDAINPGVLMDRAAAAVQQLVLQFAVWVLTIVFKLAIFIALCLGLLRFVIVQFSAMFLPVFVAFVGIPSLSGQGVRYLLGLVGVLAWPLAWGVSNVGTESLFEAITVNASTGSLWEILWALALALFLPLYVVVTYVIGPIFLGRMVTLGGNAVSSMIGSSLGQGLRLAGAGAASFLGSTASGASRAAASLSRPSGGQATMPTGGGSPSGPSSSPVNAGDLAQRYGGASSSPSVAPATEPTSQAPSSSGAGQAKPSTAKRAAASALRGLAKASALGAEAAEAGADYAAGATESLADSMMPAPHIPTKRGAKPVDHHRGLIAALSLHRHS